MAVIVSDTSPIRALEWIGQLNLLERLFGLVIVPEAVRRELLSRDGRFRPVDVTGLAFIEVRTTSSTNPLLEIDALDPGESEALRLAVELSIDTVLIDEAAGRRAAVALGIGVVGTAGILLKAKQRGLILEIAPLLNELRNGLGFFLSDAFVDRILRTAGER
ncbi:MAG: DUF3368 domain-containing protein [Planctomycetota bacterium]|nr:DUF3368 domain-containing protein [Planctomycetota bacterium]